MTGVDPAAGDGIADRPPSTAVWGLINGVTLYWSLVAALDLGVFDKLAAGPQSDVNLAAEIGADAWRFGALMDVLAAQRLVAGTPQRRWLSESAAHYLVSDAPSYLGRLVQSAPGHHANLLALSRTVRGHAPPIEIMSEFDRRIASDTFQLQLQLARTQLGRPPLAGDASSPHVVEFSRRGAPWTIAALEQHRTATATVLDDRDGLNDTRATLAEYGLLDRVALVEHPGPGMAVPPSDLVIFGHVCRLLTPDLVRRAIAAGATSLRPGGRMIISDYVVEDAATGQERATVMGITMVANRGTRVHRRDEYERWLGEASLAIVAFEAAGPGHVLVAERTGS